MLPLLIAGAVAGAAASAAKGVKASNQVNRASAAAYNQYGAGRTDYADQVSSIQGELQAQGKQAQSDWNRNLTGYLKDSPDMGSSVANLYAQRQGAMQQAGQAANAPAAPSAGSGHAAWFRSMVADRDARTSAGMAPTAFQGAAAQGREQEAVRQLGLQQKQGDVQNWLARRDQQATLSRQFAYEPMSLTQARLGPAMQQAAMAGNQSAMAGSLYSLGGSALSNISAQSGSSR